ncbi:MAG TPA: hypothetical protein VGG51_05355 [Candidatus Cybelea sp.]
MRSHMIRAGIAAIAATVALAACASHGLVPSSAGGLGQSALSPTALNDSLVQPEITTCAKSPPQYWWLFKGSCDPKITLKPTGATFTLAAYESITVKGTIGHNTTKGTASITLADATGTGDITPWKGKSFPKYLARGKTFIYAVAVNHSTQIIKPITGGGKPVLQYIVTDSKGLPGKTCGVALLNEEAGGKFIWSSFPGDFTAKGNTVTITQYAVPKGFAIPPKTPLYFGVNCWNA